MSSQWERLLKNEGAWVGSFTRLSAQGEVLQDIPSVVSLKPLDGGNLMRQTITKHPPDEPPQERVLEYRSLSKSVLFFENGAFSQGSIQWGPFSQFGAELGLIDGPHRLRLVQLFNQERRLDQLTLIREHLEGHSPSDRPDLTLEAIEGRWQGEAVTLYPDLQPSQTYSTQLDVVLSGSTVQQTLHIGDSATPICSEGIVSGNQIRFEARTPAVQVLLLPDGASSTCPIHIEPRQPVFLEVGWLLGRDRRQRMIRQYNAQGGWASLTLVTEVRV